MSGKKINFVTIEGNLIRDPELKATSTGTSVCNIGIAHNKRMKKGDEWVDKDPEFYTIVAWGGRGEQAAKYLTKGSHLTVAGQLQQRTWETNDGAKRSVVEIVAESLVYARPQEDEPRENLPEHDDEDDIPL